MSAPRPAAAGLPPRGSSKVAEPHLLGKRWLAALLLAGPILAGSGCALLQRDPAATGAGTGAEPKAAPLPPAPLVVEIDAPTALKQLLERHLDLVRLGSVARGESIGDSELARLIDAAPSQVRELLQTEGFFAPLVRITREPAPVAGAPERVRVDLDTGPQTRVARVDIEPDGALASAVLGKDPLARQTLQTLRESWPMKAGTPFRNPAWADAKAAALAQLRAAGYATASWGGTAADIDAGNHSARLYLVAESGPLFRSGEIEVEGLLMHDRQTVLNQAGFAVGTPVTETLLLDFQDRLQKSGLFERVSVALDNNVDKADAAPVLVRLAELPLHQLTVGVGVSANTGPRATLEHVYRRVLGYAATARNKAEWGRARQAWDGEISSHPGPGFYRWLAGGTVERLETDTDVVLTQRLRAGRAQDSPRIERLYFAQFDRSSRRTASSRDDARSLSAHYHWSWRDIDDPILPTRGLTVSLQGGGGQAESDGGNVRGAFGRAYGRLTAYLPLWQRWYGQARIEAGQIFARDQLEVPEGLRFRAGGDDSVRGYAYRTLGPITAGVVGSGNALLTGSVELARPIFDSMPQLWGAVFVDAGNAATSFKDFKPVLGSGFGLRWRSPVGPLKLDLAYASELRRVRLHFSVGIVF